MGANPFHTGPSAPYGAPPSPSLGYGSAQQPPRFSAGSLISDGDLPEWLRAGQDGQGAQPAQSAQPPTPQAAQTPWGALAQPQGWPPAPEPFRSDIDAQHTVRQPAFGAPAPAPQAAPFGQPQPSYPQQSYGQQQQYAQPPASYPRPAERPAYAQQPYPQQRAGMGQPPMPNYPQQQPGYGQPPASYPQTPTPGSYGGFPAFAPQIPQQSPQPPHAAPVNAFPTIEQAGSAYNGPQVGGMAGHALLDQQALPTWLAGGAGQVGSGPAASRSLAPSGMQARSLVDDQALPKWLRDQPDDAGRPNVSAWIGASAAQEPMPPVLSEAYGQAQSARAPQPNGYGAPVAPPPAAYGASTVYQPPSPTHGQPGAAGDEAALPDWLRAQAAGGPPISGPQVQAQPPAHSGQERPGGFAASDLIDPTALPDWVTGRAPAAPTFSSTQGWSVAGPEPDVSYGVAPDQAVGQGYGQSAFQSASPGYAQEDYAQQGYDQQGYDQQGYDQPLDGAGYEHDGGAQGAAIGWDDTAWGQSDAQEPIGYNQSPSQRSPLAPDELPPWLRGKGGPQAPAAPPATPERNPWASAAAPVESAQGWDDQEQWSDDDQAGQDWSAAPSGWDDHVDLSHNERQLNGWDDSAVRAGWADSSSRHKRVDPRESRESYDSYDSYGQRDQRGASRGAAGYPAAPYGADYDQMANDYGEYDYGDYDEAPSAPKGGRGWLGFLRRDKH
ncbi:MAG TPA: hypothetical protein VE338_14060 [Ktedonobacterales bacterium]|nr:hypothetical protein [Ktedonobacterales bacterium]